MTGVFGAQTVGMILAALTVPKAAGAAGKKAFYLTAGSLCAAAGSGIAQRRTVAQLPVAATLPQFKAGAPAPQTRLPSR